MSIRGPKITWFRPTNGDTDIEKGFFDIRKAEIKIENKLKERERENPLIKTNSNIVETAHLNQIKSNNLVTNQILNLFDDFTVEYLEKGTNLPKKILFRSKFLDIFGGKSIKTILENIKKFYEKFNGNVFEKINQSENYYLDLIFNNAKIENLKVLDYQENNNHPMDYLSEEQIANIKYLHYRVENSNKSFSYLEGLISNKIYSNNLRCLILETNQLNKLKEIFENFGEKFINLQDVHIFFTEKQNKQQNIFREIINLLKDKIIYMKKNIKKFLENGVMPIPFKNITFRNFINKAKVDAQLLYEFFMNMDPVNLGCIRFRECFENLNLNNSLVEDNNFYLSKLIFSFGIIKVLNIANIR